MQIAYLLYDHVTALDVVGPYEVLGSVPGAQSVFVAEHAGPIRDERGSLALVADRSLDEVTAPDIVVVPGGFGTRLQLEHRPVLAWLRDVHQTTTWTTSVCVGSLLLAAAGCSTMSQPRRIGSHGKSSPRWAQDRIRDV